MQKYFDNWKFKHPNPIVFKKIMEQESGLELDWYFEQFIETINKIDYSIYSVHSSESNNTNIILEKIEKFDAIRY